MLSTQLLGNAADGAHVWRPVLTEAAVTTCGPDGEPTMLVGQRHGQPVDFEFTDVGKCCVRQDVLRPPAPGAQFRFVADVGQAQHGQGMPVLWHVLHGSSTTSADTLGGRVQGFEFRVVFLDALEFKHKLVVLSIGEDRVVLDPVLIGRFFDVVTQIGDVSRHLFSFAPALLITLSSWSGV